MKRIVAIEITNKLDPDRLFSNKTKRKLRIAKKVGLIKTGGAKLNINKENKVFVNGKITNSVT